MEENIFQVCYRISRYILNLVEIEQMQVKSVEGVKCDIKLNAA